MTTNNKTKKLSKIELERREKKRVRDNNYRFNKMAPNRKRVRIAKDVIEQLDAKKLIAKHGTYLQLSSIAAKKKYDIRYFSWPDFEDKKSKIAETQISEVVSANSCKVCAIGAVFASAVKRANHCTIGDMNSDADGLNDDIFMRSYLKSWFSREQLALMEIAFDRTDQSIDGDASGADDDVLDAAYNFASKQTAGGRLRAIMQNIIDNDGEFVPNA